MSADSHDEQARLDKWQAAALVRAQACHGKLV
jgi:hypothetical protein